MDACRGDLDEPLEVAPFGSGRPEPDHFPLLVGLEEPPCLEGGEPAGEAVGVGHRVDAQVFGSEERIWTISATSTYPSIRFTTFPEPSTKRTVG